MRAWVVAAAICAVLLPSAPAQAREPEARVVATAFVEPGFTLVGRFGYRTILFTLYDDGHVVATGPDDEHGVTTFTEGHLAHEQVLQLRRDLARATTGVDFGDIPVADVGYTRTRAVVDGRVVRTRINAFDMDMGLTPQQLRAREALRAVIEGAQGFATRPSATRRYEVRQSDAGDPQVQVEWPGPRLPDGECGTISAATYSRFPAQFTQGSAYYVSGRALTIWVRPLLPGERACRV